MAAKCKTNPRRTKHNRASFGQRLDRRPSQPTVERKISLPDGSTLAIAHVNGVYMLGRFKGERPLDSRPELHGPSHASAELVGTADPTG